jgi:hypothetical protein
LSKGIVFAMPFNEGVGKICRDYGPYRNHATFGGNFGDLPEWIVHDGRLVLDMTDGADTTFAWLELGNPPPFLHSTKRCTMVVGWQQIGTGSDRLFDYIVDGNNDIRLSPWGTTLFFELGVSGNSYGWHDSYTTTHPLDTWWQVAGTYNGYGATNTDKIKLWGNGDELVLTDTVGTIPATGPALTTANCKIGGDAGGSAGTIEAYVEYCYLYDRDLAAWELGDLANDPYQIFERPSRRAFWYVAAAGVVAPTGALEGPLIGALGGPIG